jgi:peptidoglycan/LPS O-acetylase OafA/YrhL
VSAIFKFDSKKLDGLLSKYGVKNTWVHLLATHLNSKKEFQYILETRLFQFWAQISFTFYLSHVLFLLPARFFKFYLINNHDWTPGNSEAVSTILFLMFCVPFSYIMEIYFDSPSRLFSNSLFKIMEKKKE